MSTAAIIVAAGQSSRMGFDKLFAELDSRPVLVHSLLQFQAAACIDEILVVTATDNHALLEEWVAQDNITKLSKIVPGGDRRHHSVALGLDAVSPHIRFVAVHDGARPLIDVQDIERCCALALKHGAAACGRRITDTVKRVDGQHRVTGSVDRSNLWAMETPQVFDRQLLQRAYMHVMDHGATVTDEVSALEMLGEGVILSENLRPNLKITYPQDLELASQLLQLGQSTSA